MTRCGFSIKIPESRDFRHPICQLNVSKCHSVYLTSCSQHAHSSASWVPVRAAHVHKQLTERYVCHYKGEKKNKNHNDKLTVNLQNFCILSVLALNWLELSCKRLSGGKLCLCFLSWTVQAADTRSNSRQIDRSAFFSSWEINRGICSKVLSFFLFFFFRTWDNVNWSVSKSCQHTRLMFPCKVAQNVIKKVDLQSGMTFFFHKTLWPLPWFLKKLNHVVLNMRSDKNK